MKLGIVSKLAFAMLALFGGIAKGDLVWTGSAGDSLFWSAGNWNFSGAINAGTFLPGITFDENIFMTNAGSSASLISVATSGGIRMGNGSTLNLDNSFLTVAGTGTANGMNGIDDDVTPGVITGSPSFVICILLLRQHIRRNH